MNIEEPAARNVLDPNGRDINKVYFSSGERSESALIKTGAGVVGAIVVTTDKTNDAEAVLYDNTEASGKAHRCPVKGTDWQGGKVIPFRVDTGVYVEISGTGAKYEVYYL